jgi:hypothetical protein
MPESEFPQKFFDGKPPKGIRLVAARGLIPISPADMLPLLIRLVEDEDKEVSNTARETLNGWNEAEIVTHLQSRGCGAAVLEHFSVSPAPAIQEAIILNPEATGAIIASLATHVAAPLLEAILYNRTRLLESPEIVQNVKRNPAATTQIFRVVDEIETEFFGSKKHDYNVGKSDREDAVTEEIVEFETGEPPGDLDLEGLPLDPQERDAAILSRIGAMTVRQKIKLALLGAREARSVLIRDSNKEVSRSVLQSPKLTTNEVESFAAMRNAPDEVLRLIGSNKGWLRTYAVVHNLVKNPKTPPMISQRLLSRLHARDLAVLAHDRGISEAVRRNAERLTKQRNASKSMG